MPQTVADALPTPDAMIAAIPASRTKQEKPVRNRRMVPLPGCAQTSAIEYRSGVALSARREFVLCSAAIKSERRGWSRSLLLAGTVVEPDRVGVLSFAIVRVGHPGVVERVHAAHRLGDQGRPKALAQDQAGAH